jgi:type 1 glutamine amidotransferase
LVLYYHRKEITQTALDALESYTLEGGGILAIHSATASFKSTPRYHQILGGCFASHGPVERYDIRFLPGIDTPFSNIPEFSVKDELYLHELETDIKVHAYTFYQRKMVPIMWTRQHGNGRVCYASPGHRSETMRAPEYINLLSRALHWVCEGNS